MLWAPGDYMQSTGSCPTKRKFGYRAKAKSVWIFLVLVGALLQLYPIRSPNSCQISRQGANSDMEQLMALPLRGAREEFEREYLETQLHRFNGNISRMAAFIGMERSALHRKMKSLDIATDLQEEGKKT